MVEVFCSRKSGCGGCIVGHISYCQVIKRMQVIFYSKPWLRIKKSVDYSNKMNWFELVNIFLTYCRFSRLLCQVSFRTENMDSLLAFEIK